MSEYSTKIIEHFSDPRNIGELADANAQAFVSSPVCGDQLHLFARIVGDRVVECSFLACGCAASLATGSILSEAIRGRGLEEIGVLSEADIVELAGGFAPQQRHCATMAHQAIEGLLSDYRQPGAGGRPPADGCCPVEDGRDA